MAFTTEDALNKIKFPHPTTDDYPLISLLHSAILDNHKRVINYSRIDAQKKFDDHIDALKPVLSKDDFVNLSDEYSKGEAEGFLEGFINGYLVALAVTKGEVY